MMKTPRLASLNAGLALLLATGASLPAQTSPTPVTPDPAASASPAAPKEELVTLSPFEVQATSDTNTYNAETTLAGNRLSTELRDIGDAVSVYTQQFLKDTAATSNTSLLQYTISSEVGGIYGTFAGTGDGTALNEPMERPNSNTRVRGLAAADNTRDFFHSEIPWDAYDIDHIDLQRGPNAILFGEGSPAGIINATTNGASFLNGGDVEGRVGSYGSFRGSLDDNFVVLPHQAAIRLDLLGDNEKYEQHPAFSHDHRIAMSGRLEPAALNRNGYHTIVKAGFEAGRIDANYPRELPPQDDITPFFASGNLPGSLTMPGSTYPIPLGTNQATYNGWQLWDHQTGRIGSGESRTVYASNNTPIPYSNPWILNGNFGTTPSGQPSAFFGGNGGGQSGYWITDAPASFQEQGLDGGAIPGYVTAPGTWRTIAPTSTWAVNAGLPYSSAGIFKNNLLTNPSLFDFYHKLIDGNTKHEWQHFHRYTVGLTQTALNDQIGYSLDFNKEHYDSGQTALLGGNTALYIDDMAVFNNGTPDAGRTGVPYSDGTPNPNVGRPFVSSTGGANDSFTADSQTSRATAFATHDFRGDSKLPNWVGLILGKQTLTGLYTDDKETTDTRQWDSYGYLDPSAYGLEYLDPKTNDFTALRPTMIMYLGPTLVGRSPNGANISGIPGNPVLTNGSITSFNDTWKSSVNPSAQWTNYAYTTDPTKLAPGYPVSAVPNPAGFTQADNPANYVGWTPSALNVTSAANSLQNRNLLTTQATLNQTDVESKALVWQGKMLQDSLVGTFGWRRDTAKDYSYMAQVSPNAYLADGVTPNPNYKAIDFNDYRLPSTPNGAITVSSRSESLVAHLMDLPYLKQALQSLPFEVSLSYNTSTNFQPIAGRVDVYGQSIPPPSGKTIDRGIILETRDGRFSLKVNRFVTTEQNITDPNSAAFGFGFGDFMESMSVMTNVFQYRIGNGAWDNTNAANIGAGNPERFTFTTTSGAVTPQEQATEAAAIAGVRSLQNSINPNFWNTWGMTSLAYVQSGAPTAGGTLNGVMVVPNGFTLTDDTKSQGWEIEANANITHNWRVTLNATDEKAQRYNIGGSSMAQIMGQVLTAMAGPAGQMHFWWGTDDVPRAGQILYNYQEEMGAQWASMKLLEGTNVPEVRQWRVNLITNYAFDRSILKGFNIGGGLRYSSAVAIGYPPTGDPSNPASLGFDLQHPYMGPSETYLDAWLGYTHRINQKIVWHAQLNGTNLGKGDYLIPITAQGPIPGMAAGTAAGYRIGPHQEFTFTNRFEF